MKKTKIIYHSSFLANGLENTPARSGVYFVAYNILLEMLKREDLDVKLFCETHRFNDVKNALLHDANLKNVSLIKYSKIDSLISLFETLKVNNKKNHGDKIITRPCIKITLAFLKFLSFLSFKLNFNKYYENLFSDSDIFFSPYDIIPNQVRKINHIKKYTIIHDIIPIIFPENFTDMKNKKGWFYKLIQSFNKEDFYFANSEYTKQDVIKHIDNINPEHITTIPLSTGLPYERINDDANINRIKEKYNIPKNKKYVFSLCTLEPRKNLVFAVKNFIEFTKRNNIDDLVFVLGGGQWDIFIQKLNDTIKDLGDYQDKILRIGYVDDKDMASLYSAAEMFIFPSVYEGFGIPILEAMNCGCPVICSNVSSMPEVIGDCGIQINPKDDEDLIKAFEKMHFDSEFRKLCSQKGIERAKFFTWETCVNKIVEKFKN